MVDFLIKKITDKYPTTAFRTIIGQLAGVLGLGTNLILFIGKILVGGLTGSVSIMADAMNSLSDMISSFLTLVGFKIAAKPADKNHPYGHKRFEYISGLAVALIVTAVGAEFLKTSFKKILTPQALHLSKTMFFILILSVLLKVWQGKMYRTLAQKIDSATLEATSKDSINDVFTTVLVIVSAAIEYITNWHIDGYVGFFLAIYILISGIKMVKDFIDELLGSRPTEKEIKQMEDHLDQFQTILGYHDLLVHDYGPEKKFASVHIEVDANWDLMYAHRIIDEIEENFYDELGVNLVCHLDPVMIHDEHYLQLSTAFDEFVNKLDPQLKIHDFRIKDDQTLQFDLVIPENFKMTDQEITNQLEQFAQRSVPAFHLEVTFDHHYLL
ncbi:MAG TPA: cation diffusion facilitator family transporter [Candidatus Tetragenococcus pullicola]|nr:cation diffusion facilitator family transporter [Candidatus Tetragenococcus pullicola]